MVRFSGVIRPTTCRTSADPIPRRGRHARSGPGDGTQLRLVQRLAAVMWALVALRPLRHLMEERKVQVQAFKDVHLSDIHVLTMAPANVNVIWFLSGDLVDLRLNTAPGKLSRNVRLQIVRL